MYRAPRGTADILPEEQHFWRHVEDEAARLAALYGYQRLDTPVFEDAGLFVRTIGEGTDIVEKETYTFPDKGGSLLTLRPEGTAPVARAYLEHGMGSLPKPVKLYYFCPVFRYERPPAGRLHQHHQFGIEAIGEADPALDVEVIQFAWELMNNIGLKKPHLVINSFGCPVCRRTYVAELRNFYEMAGGPTCQECARHLEQNPLRLLDCEGNDCQELIEHAPPIVEYLCADCAAHYAEVRSHLETLGIPYFTSYRLLRSLDYYTRTAFEIEVPSGPFVSVAGGSRYDGLIQQLGGSPTPAVGFAATMERMVGDLRTQRSRRRPAEGVTVIIACQPEVKQAALQLAAYLRAEGIAVDVAYGRPTLRDQLRHTEAMHAPFAAIVGPEELSTNTVMLRDMTKGTQERLDLVALRQRLATYARFPIAPAAAVAAVAADDTDDTDDTEPQD